MRNGGSQNQNSQQQPSHHLQNQQTIEGNINGNQNNSGSQNPQNFAMRDNLHYAADSVSNAMTSLVRELNSGADSVLIV